MAYPSIVSALEGVEFPINKKDLIEQIGDREVEIVTGQTLSMRELLNVCTKENYQNPHDVVGCPEIVQKIESTKQMAA
ncbi:MAG: hypothetical protein K6T91_03820 [Firmicutes bacterium]|nr:hypothetical protein [Bacillota bacterium]